MKKIFIFIIFSSFFGLFPAEINAKISAAPLTDIKKVIMTYGYKGVFCKVDNESITADEILTLYWDDAPPSHYESLFSKAQCTNEEDEFLIGETTLEYYDEDYGDYSQDDTFIIKDEKMYRAGVRSFSYYEDRTSGGSYKSSFDNQLINGLEVIGSSYFFNSEYDKDATIGARLEQSGYIKHFAKDGSMDWTLLAFNNEVFKLKTIIKQEQNVVLLDDTADKDLTSVDPIANWKTYEGKGFSFKYPTELDYEIANDTEAQHLVVFEGSNISLSFDARPDGSFESRLEPIETKNINGIQWNLYPESEYCDAGNCGATSQVYQASYDKKFYSFYLRDIEQNEIEQILSTFKFSD